MSAPVRAEAVCQASAADPTAEVDISIHCANLADMDTFSKSDPFVVAYMALDASARQTGVGWEEIGRTEIVWDNLNPHFAHSFRLNYHFERLQYVRFDVYDADTPTNVGSLAKHDFIGTTGSLRLGDIVSGMRRTAGYKLTRPDRAKNGKHTAKSFGSLFTIAEQVGSSTEVALFKLSAAGLPKMDFFGQSDPFLEIKRRSPDGTRWVTVHRTAPIMKTLAPSWSDFCIRVSKLCPNEDRRRPLRLEVWDYNKSGDHDYIGAVETSLDALTAGDAPTQLLNEQVRKKRTTLCCMGHQPRSGGTTTAVPCGGHLIYEMIRVVKEDTFVDYIQGGCEINLMVSIDFTASNGNPNDPHSLHALNPNSRTGNAYQQAIQAVGSILESYDSDGYIPALGFGARFPNGAVSHCFNLNGLVEPECRGVNGVLDAYGACLNRVQLYGPTNFSDFIDYANRCAASARITQARQQYFILLVLTDGCISDMQQTVDTIVAGSNLPLSIVVVGVGDADFSSMESLDADEARLVSSSGQMQTRDTVQFVPFNKFKGVGPAHLAAEVLQEIPAQLLGYMKARGIRPNPPAHTPAGVVRAVPIGASAGG